MIELLWPWAFALAPLPLLLRALLPPRAHRDAALRVPFSLPWRSIESGAARGTGQRGALLLLVLAWLGLLAALARPTWVGEPVALPNEGQFRSPAMVQAAFPCFTKFLVKVSLFAF